MIRVNILSAFLVVLIQASPAAAADQLTLVLDWFVNPDHGPLIVAAERGYFKETFHAQRYAEAGMPLHFVQDNLSRSGHGILRGLHLQAAPHAQAKLVRVSAGAVLDVCVDLRADSPSFGKHVSVRLDAVDHDMLYIPAGLAHGFLANAVELLGGLTRQVDAHAGGVNRQESAALGDGRHAE